MTETLRDSLGRFRRPFSSAHECYTGIMRRHPDKVALSHVIRDALTCRPDELEIAHSSRRSHWDRGYMCPDCHPTVDSEEMVRGGRDAMASLKVVLSQEQFSNLFWYGMFVTIDKAGNLVVIKWGVSGNLFKRAARGWDAYCCHPESMNCVEQCVLEQYLALMSDECDRFWRTAIWTRSDVITLA